MTFNNAAYAIDGARTPAAAAREAVYTTGGGQSGVSQPGDLRVTATSPNGPTLRISQGSAAVLNGYQTNPDQAYTISNPSPHITAEVDMPPAVPQTAYYLVCIVIGDPEFDQTGHPFMPSEFDPEQAEIFQYVRPVVIPCTSNTTTFEQLGKAYPGIALARLQIPANTTILTPGMITDVRQLASSRSERRIFQAQTTGSELTDIANWQEWIYFQPTIRVPEWATGVNIIATYSGLMSTGKHSGDQQLRFGPHIGPTVSHVFDADGLTERVTLSLAMGASMVGYGGQSLTLRTAGMRLDPALSGGSGYLSVMASSLIIFDVNFHESVI